MEASRRNIIIICDNCGKTIDPHRVYKAGDGHSFCSIKCREQYMNMKKELICESGKSIVESIDMVKANGE